jgi:SPASM domain peptide maturase of grasp-with-spasm system
MKSTDEKFLMLYSNCIPVKGYSRSVICDLQMQNYFFIPNSLYKVLTKKKTKTFFTHNDIPNEYKQFLIEKNVVFEFGKELSNLYPRLDLNFFVPSKITNVIINVGNNNITTLLKDSLDELNCIALQLYFDESFILNDIRNVLSFFIDSRINTVECFFHWNETYSSDDIISLYTDFYFSCFVIYHAPDDVIKAFADALVIQFSEFDREFVINPLCFNVNLKLFSESQSYNTYFNRKLFIGNNGEIKNDSNCDRVFGFVQNLTSTKDLISIISSEEFQRLWFVHKEMIEICRDCENRHMCVDSRIPFQNENGTWYHKTECIYNPYTAKWKGEEGYVPLEECGTYLGETNFVINKRKVNKLNKQIWGE